LRKGFKTELVHLAPVVASLLFGVACAYLLLVSQIGIFEVTIFPEGAGSFGNALYFVVLVAVGAFLLYLLVKRKSRRLISLITGFALVTAVFMLSSIYLLASFSMLDIPYADASTLILSTLVTVLACFAVYRAKSRVGSMVVVFLGGALGTFLGFAIPTLSTILILTFLAVYDAFAVYYGPVGKIARSGLEQLRGLSYSFKDVQMGLGDLTFYSMLTSRVLFDAGALFCLASASGVLIGVALAFKMLEKKGMFPGLPFPTALGLIPLIVSFFLR